MKWVSNFILCFFLKSLENVMLGIINFYCCCYKKNMRLSLLLDYFIRNITILLPSLRVFFLTIFIHELEPHETATWIWMFCWLSYLYALHIQSNLQHNATMAICDWTVDRIIKMSLISWASVRFFFNMLEIIRLTTFKLLLFLPAF